MEYNSEQLLLEEIFEIMLFSALSPKVNMYSEGGVYHHYRAGLALLSKASYTLIIKLTKMRKNVGEMRETLS